MSDGSFLGVVGNYFPKAEARVEPGARGSQPLHSYSKYPEWIAEEPNYAEVKILLQSWLEEGISMFGGCCGTSPDLIKFYKQELSEIQRKKEGRISSSG